jgi:hypothetical protein
MFDAETTELGTMSADTWRRTLEYHADAYGGPCDIDVATVRRLGARQRQPLRT